MPCFCDKNKPDFQALRWPSGPFPSGSLSAVCTYGALTALTTDRMLLIFIIAGMFMETTPNIVILAPLLYPVAQQIGMDQIHFCIFMVTSLGLGFITPPMGLNLFVVSSLTGQPIMTIARYAFPFVVVMVIVSALIGFVPQISLWAIRH